ncbi:hypothetical protein B4144_2161 [Bacillus atrophaeus]|nr:hypothetical protein B4144_2161 [Bacillus atrophaeus]
MTFISICNRSGKKADGGFSDYFFRLFYYPAFSSRLNISYYNLLTAGMHRKYLSIIIPCLG